MSSHPAAHRDISWLGPTIKPFTFNKCYVNLPIRGEGRRKENKSKGQAGMEGLQVRMVLQGKQPGESRPRSAVITIPFQIPFFHSEHHLIFVSVVCPPAFSSSPLGHLLLYLLSFSLILSNSLYIEILLISYYKYILFVSSFAKRYFYIFFFLNISLSFY